MKTKIFYGIIAVFAFGAIYLANQKYHFLSNGESDKGDILPTSQWSSVLIGEWSFNSVLKGEKQNVLEEGKVNFKADSSFEWRINRKEYGAVIKSNNAKCIAGGNFRGKWLVNIDSSFIKLTKENFDVEIGYFPAEEDGGTSKREKKMESLRDYFSKTWFLGKYQFPNAEISTSTFTSKKIVFVTKYYISGADGKFVLTKID